MKPSLSLSEILHIGGCPGLILTVGFLIIGASCTIAKTSCELSLAQLVWFLVVEPAHPGSSPRLGMDARIFLDFPGFNRRFAFSGR